MKALKLKENECYVLRSFSEETVPSFQQILKGAGDPQKLRTTDRDGNCFILE